MAILKTTLAEVAKDVSVKVYWSVRSSAFVEAFPDAEGVVDAAELAAAFPGHQPLDCLHPTNADVEVKHKINKANFRVFMILFSSFNSTNGSVGGLPINDAKINAAFGNTLDRFNIGRNRHSNNQITS